MVDGDKIETAITLIAENSSISSVVSIETQVEAAASCLWSRAWAEPALPRITEGASLEFYIQVNDVYNLPVGYTRSNIELEQNGVVLSRAMPAVGGNSSLGEEVVVVPVDVMHRSGAHLFRIILKSGWNHEIGSQADCVLLEHRIDIIEGTWPATAVSTNTAAIIGATAGAVAVVVAFCCICFYKWASLKCLQSVIPGMGVSSRTVLFS